MAPSIHSSVYTIQVDEVTVASSLSGTVVHASLLEKEQLLVGIVSANNFWHPVDTPVCRKGTAGSGIHEQGIHGGVHVLIM